MEKPKTRKLIDVKGFLRGDEIVKPYKRSQLVNVDKSPTIKAKSLEELQSELDGIHDKFESRYGAPTDKVQKEWQDGILNAYGGEHSGVYDPSFNNEHEAAPLKKIYQEGGYSLNLNVSVGLDEAYDILTNRNSNIIEYRAEQSKKAEKLIQEITNAPTERTDPFSFRIKSTLDEVAPIANDVYDRISRKPLKQEKSIKDRYMDEFDNHSNGDLAPQSVNETNVRRLTEIVDSIFRGSDLNEKTIATKILPSVITTELMKPHDHNPNYMNNEEINQNFTKAIEETLPEDLKNQGALLGDPENIRSQLKKLVQKQNQQNTEAYKFVEGTPITKLMEEDSAKIASKLKSMKASDVPIFFTYMMTHSRIFGGLDNPDLMKSIQNFSNAVAKVGSKAIDNKKNDYIHFSNNPMELLTMSPDGFISSCQSVSEGGHISISSYNMNVASSLYGIDDFVIFRKQMGSNIKNERMSVTFDEDAKRFKSQENKSVYAQPMEGEYLKKSLENNGVWNSIKSENGGRIYGEAIESIQFGGGFSDIVDEFKDKVNNGREFIDDMHNRFDKEVSNADEQEELKSRLQDDQDYEHNGASDDFEEKQENYKYEAREEFEDALSDAINSDEMNQSYLYSSPIDYYKQDKDDPDEIYRHVQSKAEEYNDDFDDARWDHTKLHDEFETAMKELEHKARRLE